MTDYNETDDDQDGDASDSYRHTYDPATDSVSHELVRAVAVLNDADPTELAILADVIDPEALDALFQSHPDGRPRDSDGRIVFEYDDHEIQITDDGTITIGSVEAAIDD